MGVSYEAIENSTLLVSISFTDSLGNTFNQDTSEWQLTKVDGTVINNRTFANGSFTGTRIVLSGDDLALDSSGDIERILTIRGTYTASYGSNLPFYMEKRFWIKNNIN